MPARSYLTAKLQDGGDDHGHVAALKQVCGGEEACGGHAIVLARLQEHLDVLHLQGVYRLIN